MHVLIVDDDSDVVAYVANGLRQEGHVVDSVADGRDGLAQALTSSYDVVILDRMLPKLDGLSVVKAMRSAGCKVPVLFLTSRSGVDDRVDGLDGGGDDYLVKPFAFSELLARVHALGRRPRDPQEVTTLRVADLEMNLVSRRVTRAGKLIDLQPREFTLLEVLMRNRSRVVTRTMLLERVWDFNFDPKTSVVETHISRLRAKIDKPFATELIRTLRGSGYSIDDAP